jgi:transposase
MPNDDAPFTLTAQQRARVQQLVRTTLDARLLRRGQAILWRASGESTACIAQRLAVSRQTVHNWLTQFRTRPGAAAARLADAERSGRPPPAQGIIDPLVAELIDGDPRDYSYAATVWTAPLLQRYLAEQHEFAVSEISVRRAIHRVGRRWKRPRYRLALRPARWRQAKGGCRGACRAACGRSF